MQYIAVRNLEKYHPGYKDRNLIWAKIFFKMVQGDPECEMISNEIDWARLIKFILLELQAQKPLPLDPIYLQRKGFDLKKRSIEKTLNALQTFIEVSTEVSNPVTPALHLCNVEKSKIREEKEKSKIYSQFEKLTFTAWNSFCDKYPTLTAIRNITPERRVSLKKRFGNKDFVESWPKVLEFIPKSKFLLGENNHKWKVSFDWLIKNDTNYIKVLESKYEVREDKWKKYLKD